MKKYNILAMIGLLFSGFMLSCYDDKGNYDYHWVDNVNFETIRDTSIDRGAVLRIEPDLSVGRDDLYREENPDDYTYSWVAEKLNRGNSTDTIKYLLSTKHSLDDTIWLEVRSEPYQVTYTVKDKKNSNLRWTTKFNLKVNRRISEGFLFLTEDKDKKVELDIYARRSDGTTFLEKGVLGRSGFPYAGGGANCVLYLNDSKEAYKKLWIATGEATGWLDIINFQWNEKNLVKSLMLEPKPLSYTFTNMILCQGQMIFFNPSGAMHYLDNYNIISSNVAKLNSLDFEAHPDAGRSLLSSYIFLIYNKKDKCFVSFSRSPMSADAECKNLPDKEAAKGMELVYMQSIELANRVMAVLKNPATGDLYLYSYIVGSFSIALEYTTLLAGTGNMEQAEHFVFDNRNGFFYYSIGRQLYNYRQGEGSVAINEFDAPITLLSTLALERKDQFNEYAKSVVVATYSESEDGKVHLLHPDPAESKTLVPYGETMEHLGCVKSVDYLR